MSYGIAVTNVHLVDGCLRTRARFSQQPSNDVSGGLLIGFHSQRARYLMVQLGAYGRAYSIAKFNPGMGWSAIENAGSAANLEPDRDYEIVVRLVGQEIRMAVDGVSVLEALLSDPLSGS